MTQLPPNPVYMMKGNMGPIHSLLFNTSSSVEHIYAGAESGLVHVWDLRTNRELLKLNSTKEPCLGLQIFNNQCLLTQRKGGDLNLWLARDSTWEINKTLETNYYAYCRCQKSTENTLFIPLNNSKIGLFSLKSHKIEVELDPLIIPGIKELGDVMAIKPCLDESNNVLVAYDIGKVLLWDVRLKKVLSSLKTEASPMTLDFNTSVMSGVMGTPESNLTIFSLSENHELSEKKLLPLKNPGTSIVTIRPDVKLFATGGWDGRIRIFSWKKFKPLVILDPHKDTIHDIIYSYKRIETYDSDFLMAAAGKDGIISLWNIYN